jgi:plasmid stabilization system protein ParE
MKVVLSAKATRQLEVLLNYFETEWSPKTRRAFQKRLNRFIRVIKKTPNAFPASKIFPDCRKCVVSPQTSLYDRVVNEVIQIIAVRDNRQQL